MSLHLFSFALGGVVILSIEFILLVLYCLGRRFIGHQRRTR